MRGVQDLLTNFWPIILIFLLIAVLRGLLLLQRRSQKESFKNKEFLLTPAERSFFHVLLGCIRPDQIVFAKVRLADVVSVAGPNRGAAWNRIAQKHVDFCICEKSTSRIIGVVELDDSSHNSENRKRRDEFLDACLRSAGIPISRVKASSGYVRADVESALASFVR